MVKMKYGAAAIGVHLCVLVFATAPAMAGWFDSAQKPAAAAIVDPVIDQIQRALDDQRYLDAARMLDERLAADSDDPRLVLLSGELNLARSHYTEALASFKRIEAVPSVRARALEDEGFALSSTSRSDEAVTALQAAVALNPATWRAWNALGAEFDRRHDWEKADAAYDHAMTNSGGAALVLNNRGFSRLSQNRLDDAVTDFVAALQKKPDLTSARNNLRLAIAMKGDYGRAVAGGGDNDRAAILNNAGFAAMLRGDYSQAKDLLGQAIKAKGEYYAVAAANLKTAQNLEASHGTGSADSHASVQ